ncbi:MAG: AMP-binding protein [Clostridiales bacterium]|jgi:long-chain acyl-CoA synthetase|nr:AMP-binding protein [Clostridiales bacterium]
MISANYPLYEVEPLGDLRELVNHNAEKYGSDPAFIFERNNEIISVSYQQFKADIEALGTAFYDMDIKNAKIAVLGENSYEWILTYFTTVNSGNVIVPLDNQLPVEEVKNLVEHSEASVFIYSESYSDIAEHLKENVASIKHYINMKNLRNLKERGFTLLVKGVNSVADYKLDQSVLAMLSYTSGTTGKAKGVMLSHSNLTSEAVAICKNIFFPKKSLLVLPLHHASGFLAFLCMSIYGTSIVINSSMKNLRSDFLKYEPHITVFVPLMIETFYKQLKSISNANCGKQTTEGYASQLFGENLSVIISGGAPLDKQLVEGFRTFGIEVINAYGLTECSGIISTGRNDYNRAGSCGQIVPCAEVKVSNPDKNGHGEIWTRGKHVMLGYYKNEQASKEVFVDEWLKTGDIGYVDADGFLYVTGRAKNMILLSNGKNVYPEEVEMVIQHNLTYVKEVVVYADDNEIVAEMFLDIVNHPECLSGLNHDIGELNRSLPPFKNISRIVVRETEFPKTTTRKIKRWGDFNNAK